MSSKLKTIEISAGLVGDELPWYRTQVHFVPFFQSSPWVCHLDYRRLSKVTKKDRAPRVDDESIFITVDEMEREKHPSSTTAALLCQFKE